MKKPLIIILSIFLLSFNVLNNFSSPVLPDFQKNYPKNMWIVQNIKEPGLPLGKNNRIADSSNIDINLIIKPIVLEENNDNSIKLQELIDKAGTRATINLPDGKFFFENTISIYNKGIRLIGTGNTVLVFKNGITGFIVNRDRSTPPCLFKDIAIIVQGEKFNPNAHGLDIHSITNLENVTIQNFGGRGVSYTADIVAKRTDVSHSSLRNVEVIDCGGDGFYFQGGDANAIGVYDCSARDNKGYGFYDHSFLGNRFFNCMGHNNKKGHYRADDPNNRAAFFGCYGEGGSPKSYIGGAGRVYGGIHADGWDVKEWAKADFQ